MKLPDALLTVARHLGDLRDRVVFVGGMIRQLLVTDPAAGPARPTKDVDLIVDVPSYAALQGLHAQLRSQGFRESTEEGAPICRWVVAQVSVDLMPLDPGVLGFSNVWYPGSLASAIPIDTAAGSIRVINAPHFCATKIEAFASRGEGDLYHHDLEDVIALVEGRQTLPGEIAVAPDGLRDFVGHAVSRLLGQEAFRDALPGHLAGDHASQARLPLVRARLEEIAALADDAVSPAKKSRGQGVHPTPAIGTVVLPDVPLLRSSNLRSVRYDRPASTLTIQFRNGRLYDYYAVPEALYQGLLAAGSAGRYHHQWIKGRFRYKRLR